MFINFKKKEALQIDLQQKIGLVTRESKNAVSKKSKLSSLSFNRKSNSSTNYKSFQQHVNEALTHTDCVSKVPEKLLNTSKHQSNTREDCDEYDIKEVQVEPDQCEDNLCNDCDEVVHENPPVYNLFDKFAVKLSRPKLAAAEAALKKSKIKNINTIEDISVTNLVSKRRQRKLRKIERQKTAGPNWFNMKSPEIDNELKTNLELLRLRSVIDPKRFYRKTDHKTKPKYFHVCK